MRWLWSAEKFPQKPNPGAGRMHLNQSPLIFFSLAERGPGFNPVMLDAMTKAASGLQAASLWMQSTASNVANSNTKNYRPTAVAFHTKADGGVSAQLVPSPRTDLETQMVSQMEASTAARANMAVFSAAGRAYKSLIDIIA
jgi:flagellar basal body rod protein FlgC